VIDPDTVEVGGGFDLLAFEDWYGGRPPLDKVTVQLVADESSLISALEAGDVDMVDILPLIGYDQIAAIDDITIVEAAGTNWTGLAMNETRPPWDNPDARMAVAKALDREDLIERGFFGRAIPAIGPIAPAFGWVYQEDAEDPQAFDLEAAKELAASAGLDGVQVNLITNPETRIPELLRNQLGEIGLDIQIESMQQNAYAERRNSGDYDMDVLGSVVDVDPDDNVWNFVHSEGPFNTFGYNNPEADKLADGQRLTSDQEERAQILQDLRLLVAQDAAYAFMYHYPDLTAFYNKVQGYVPIPEQRYLEHLWLDE
jgi:peptide/nickel transport system substrate-binding protein